MKILSKINDINHNAMTLNDMEYSSNIFCVLFIDINELIYKTNLNIYFLNQDTNVVRSFSSFIKTNDHYKKLLGGGRYTTKKLKENIKNNRHEKAKFKNKNIRKKEQTKKKTKTTAT